MNAFIIEIYGSEEARTTFLQDIPSKYIHLIEKLEAEMVDAKNKIEVIKQTISGTIK